jgi:hypothetical protein
MREKLIFLSPFIFFLSYKMIQREQKRFFIYELQSEFASELFYFILFYFTFHVQFDFDLSLENLAEAQQKRTVNIELIKMHFECVSISIFVDLILHACKKIGRTR